MNEKLLNELKNPELMKKFDETQEDDFFEFLDGMDEIDDWKTVDLGSIRIERDTTGKAQTGLCLTHLGDTYPRKYYPVHDGAYFSVKRRADNNSGILSKLKPEDAAKMLNMSWPTLSGQEALLLDRAGNLIGLHSKKYSALLQKDVFRHLSVYMRMDYENAIFQGAEYSHLMTSATYEIDDAALVNGYVKELEKRTGSPINAKDVKFYVSLWTGDSAECSVKIFPQILVKGDLQVPFSKPIVIVHRDKASIKDVDDQLTKLYSYITDALAHIQKMMNIHIEYAEEAVVRIVKKYKLPKKLVKPLAPHFKMTGGMSAHDIFFNLARFLEDPSYRALTVDRRIEYADTLTKILLIGENEWKRLDRPGSKLDD